MDVKGYWTIKETAKEWGITQRRIVTLCNGGRVDGAIRFGNAWAIPEGAPKPADARIKSGAYIKNKN